MRLPRTRISIRQFFPPSLRPRWATATTATKYCKHWPRQTGRSRQRGFTTRCTTPPRATGASRLATPPSYTMVSAYDGSFSAGLMEALSLVATGQCPVMLVAYDTDYPTPLREKRPIGDAFAVALLLRPTPGFRHPGPPRLLVEQRVRSQDAPARIRITPGLRSRCPRASAAGIDRIRSTRRHESRVP